MSTSLVYRRPRLYTAPSSYRVPMIDDHDSYLSHFLGTQAIHPYPPAHACLTPIDTFQREQSDDWATHFSQVTNPFTSQPYPCGYRARQVHRSQSPLSTEANDSTSLSHVPGHIGLPGQMLHDQLGQSRSQFLPSQGEGFDFPAAMQCNLTAPLIPGIENASGPSPPSDRSTPRELPGVQSASLTPKSTSELVPQSPAPQDASSREPFCV